MVSHIRQGCAERAGKGVPRETACARGAHIARDGSAAGGETTPTPTQQGGTPSRATRHAGAPPSIRSALAMRGVAGGRSSRVQPAAAPS
eukprot:1811436-Prymnesium_polylepis.1